MIVTGTVRTRDNCQARTLCVAGMIVLALFITITGCKNETTNPTSIDYKKYATEEVIVYTSANGDTLYTGTRYNREFQHRVENVLIGIDPTDVYEAAFFHLDETNTDHFYEDIRKYGHYVFGWVDWYFKYATDSAGNFVLANQAGVADPTLYGVWVGMNNPNTSGPTRIWTANHSIENYQNYLQTGNSSYLQNPCSPIDPNASPMREVYKANR